MQQKRTGGSNIFFILLLGRLFYKKLMSLKERTNNNERDKESRQHGGNDSYEKFKALPWEDINYIFNFSDFLYSKFFSLTPKS